MLPEFTIQTALRALWVLCVLTAANAVPVVAGEKPQIERLFPPGAQRGSTVTVSLTGKPGDGPLQIWSDRGQLTFSVAEKGDSVQVTVPGDASPGIHRLRFFNMHGASPLKAFVVGNLAEISEKEPNNKLADAQHPGTSQVVVNGVLQEGGDVDTYAVSLVKGQTLVAAMLAYRELDSPMDATLQLLNPRGTLVEQNDDDHGNDPQLVHEAREDGVYFVRTFAFPSAPNSTIQFSGAPTYIYRLTLTTGPFADYSLPMTAEAAKPAEVHLVGWNLPASQQQVSVTPQPGESVTPLSGRDLGLPLAVDVVPYSSTAEGTDSAAADHAPPFSVSGVIRAPREQDSFWFVGRKDQRLRIRAVARARFSQLDPMVTVYSEDGKELVTADDIDGANMDASTDVTIPADGRYRIQVKDRFDHGGLRFFYYITCEEPQPTFFATLAENAFAMAPEMPLSIAVSIDRRDGFAGVIDFQVEGLPEGIVAETARSEKEGDSAKTVTLKLTGAPAAGFSGPLRIRAVSPDGPQRLVTAVISGSTDTSDTHWLSAQPAVAAAPAAAEGAATPEKP
jgi:hypothetical protein